MAIVCKFGGTSAKDGQTLEHIVDNIILPNPDRRVIVVSAPGRRYSGDIKVTDSLIKIANSYFDSGRGASPQYRIQLIEDLHARFYDIVDHLGIDRSFLDPSFDSFEAAVRQNRGVLNGYRDSLKPFGEIINARILAELLRRRGANAVAYFPENIGMITDGKFERAQLLDSSYADVASHLNPALQRGEIAVVPGFYGADKRGRFTTFERSGSDITGAILANAIDASLYENWTDTDGIRRADPKVIPDAEFIERLTYREAREMAYSGADVLHHDTLLPLISKGIPLNVRNTFNISHSGTYVSKDKPGKGHVVEAVVHKDGFAYITVEEMGMNDRIGYISRLSRICARNELSIEHMPSSVDSLTLIVQLNGDNRTDHIVSEIRINRIISEIKAQKLVGDAGDIRVDYKKSQICVVGEGMRHTPGILSRITTALGNAGVNIEVCDQGSSERNIIFGIRTEDAPRAVRAVYDAYFRCPAPIK